MDHLSLETSLKKYIFSKTVSFQKWFPSSLALSIGTRSTLQSKLRSEGQKEDVSKVLVRERVMCCLRDIGLSRKLMHNVWEARRCILEATFQGKIIRKEWEENQRFRALCSKGKGEEGLFSVGPDDQYLFRILKPQDHCKTMQFRNYPRALLNIPRDTYADLIPPQGSSCGRTKRTVVRMGRT